MHFKSGAALCPCSKGLAAIDVVVAISLCGIVAAFAIPRLTHLENDVRATEIVALSVNLRSSAAAAHEQFVESGRQTSFASLRGRSVRLQNGYPDAGSAGIQMVVADVSEFTVTATPNAVTYSKIGAADEAGCAVTYHSAPASGKATVSDVTTRGC
jgi:MSHA pilin protein MshA